MQAIRLRGLYAITPEEPDTAVLRAKVERALAGGAAAVQYRSKGLAQAQRRAQAQALLALCRARAVPLIVNDDVALAIAVGADGVHLGEGDDDLAQARAALGEHRLLGASCYDSLERALAAQAAGADYVAFGAVFPSPTKPQARRASLDLLRRARAQLRVPIVAIGGITPENAAGAIAAGADAIAVLSALFDAADVEARARALAGLFG